MLFLNCFRLTMSTPLPSFLYNLETQSREIPSNEFCLEQPLSQQQKRKRTVPEIAKNVLAKPLFF
ncbi:hypothetical protein PGTUg99_028842 [Puccinia graminis f. sp. tritici]|uniref:Uncharacterized protein n=1 Tax=Puccinia graminis f. sp. tritici TaxID=56615 RepID=A0A5B0RPB7_PUCGR|nr:hypothetical protein PGTUg99_028842 [Puccinia graminis f. sp. tritici]